MKKLKNKEDVWDITVPTTHHFALENGTIVHNCADMMRYWAVTEETKPFVRPIYNVQVINYA